MRPTGRSIAAFTTSLLMAVSMGCESTGADARPPPDAAAGSEILPQVESAASSREKQERLANLDKIVTVLQKHGEVDEARRALAVGFDRSGDFAILDKWLQLDDNLTLEMQARKRLTGVTAYDGGETPNRGRDAVKGAGIGGTAGGIAGPSVLGVLLFTGVGAAIAVLGGQGEARKWVEDDPAVPVLSLSIADDALRLYDSLKQSQITLRGILKGKAAQGGATLERCDKLLTAQQQLAGRILADRTDFLSYDFVSPYLARTDQLLLHARLLNAASHDQAKLQDAAREMAKGASRGLVLETHDDVRKQFFEVYIRLKEVAGKAELEELKVLQNLTDSLGRDDMKGADRWWPQQ